MFIPYGQAPTSETSSTAQSFNLNERLFHDQLIFPFMNFTCNGTISSLMFIARLSEGISCPFSGASFETLLSWPHFYLWHYNSIDWHFHGMCSVGPSRPDQLFCRHILNTNRGYQIGLIEMVLPTPVQVQAGDILGLRQQNTSVAPQFQEYATVSVIRQKKGYGLTFICRKYSSQCSDPRARQVPPNQMNRENQQMPFIAGIMTNKAKSI